MNKNGLFITFEGPDGSGKSTILANIYNFLKKNKYSFHISITREPGGRNNPIAEDIRNILLNKIEYQISPRAETLLFAASRAQHVKDFIQPNLQKGNLVLCDRYIHSSLVYQGYARKLGIKEV
jgi:dTMP kinase